MMWRLCVDHDTCFFFSVRSRVGQSRTAGPTASSTLSTNVRCDSCEPSPSSRSPLVRATRTAISAFSSSWASRCVRVPESMGTPASDISKQVQITSEKWATQSFSSFSVSGQSLSTMDASLASAAMVLWVSWQL